MNSQESSKLSDVELAWTRERATYLDSFREPAPPTWWSILGDGELGGLLHGRIVRDALAAV
jgi:hypothetical protein